MYILFFNSIESIVQQALVVMYVNFNSDDCNFNTLRDHRYNQEKILLKCQIANIRLSRSEND